jgi:dolichyl-diphosphooligosaccharide--protein glycosyltransferase
MGLKGLMELFTGLHRPRMKRRTAVLLMALIIIFASALILRLFPAKYGFYLNEFDPFYNYYATRFLVERVEEKGLIAGLADYMGWRDTRSWYPEGRAVAPTSQAGLHLAGGFLYLIARHIFGAQVSLYDFLILLPVFAGALTTIAIYLLVKRIGGAGAGLLAALLIAYSPPIIQRGSLGWFKSEPLALLLAVTGLYLILVATDSRASYRGALTRATLAGILLGYSNTAWGGSQFFTILVAFLFLASPFLQVDLSRLRVVALPTTAFTLLASSILPRPGPGFISSPAGLALLLGALFTLVAHQVKIRTPSPKQTLALIKALLAIVVLGLAAASFGLVSPVSLRYLTVVYPFQRSANPLVESVAEHYIPTGFEYVASYGLFLFLAALGVVVSFRRRGLEHLLALLLGILGLYLASSFSRLMVFSSLALAVLGGLGFTELTTSLLRPTTTVAAKRRVRAFGLRSEVKVLYALIVIILVALPAVYPPNRGWLDIADTPVALANGASSFRVSLPDWVDALNWLRENTPPDAVIASWWDYGYWITVMGNRTSLADNATINGTRIALLGRMFISNETEALEILRKLRADYVLIFLAGQRVRDPAGTATYYVLGGGGDESKKQWFMRIAGLNESNYLYGDGFTPKPAFWDTFLGKMMPFHLYQYIDQTGRFVGREEWKPGYQAVYLYEEKYSRDGKGPVELVYVSPSLKKPMEGSVEVFTAILIYRVNWDRFSEEG